MLPILCRDAKFRVSTFYISRMMRYELALLYGKIILTDLLGFALVTGYLCGKALQTFRTLSPNFKTIPDDLAARIYGRGLDDFEVLYHGTSSNRAAKITGSKFFETKGFRKLTTFFAEDYPTAKYFAFEQIAKYNEGETIPKSLTIIKFKIPKYLAFNLKIGTQHRQTIGEYWNLPFIYIEGGTGHERILNKKERIDRFNDALKSEQITTQRLRVRL